MRLPVSFLIQRTISKKGSKLKRQFAHSFPMEKIPIDKKKSVRVTTLAWVFFSIVAESICILSDFACVLLRGVKKVFSPYPLAKRFMIIFYHDVCTDIFYHRLMNLWFFFSQRTDIPHVCFYVCQDIFFVTVLVSHATKGYKMLIKKLENNWRVIESAACTSSLTDEFFTSRLTWKAYKIAKYAPPKQMSTTKLL